jgi:hypothetical protein
MATKIQLRRDTTVNWAAGNPVLAEGEIGIDLTINRMKVGDGVKTWALLPYTAGDAASWTRTGTVVEPKTAGDQVHAGTGKLTVGGTAATPNIEIKADGGIVANTDGLVYDASSGSLLVGTSTRASAGDAQFAKLQILGNTAGSSNGALIALMRQQAATASLNAGDLLGKIDFTDNAGNPFGSIFCEADGSTGANDYPGRLVLATTAGKASSPTPRTTITSTGRFSNISTEDGIFSATTQAPGTSLVLFEGRHGATAGVPLSGTPSFQVQSNGNAVNANNYGAFSDIKLKENIVDASSQWNDLKALQVRNYNFKKGQTHTQIGLVAQEAELVSPGLVSESPDRDEDGNDLGTVTKSVNYSVLYMKAVKALQEAMGRIEALEAKVVALESRP